MSYDNPRHLRSQQLAAKEIAARMRNRPSALQVPGGTQGPLNFLYACLDRIGTIPPAEKRDLFYGTAVDFLPFGKFGAQTCFPPAEPAFVLVDTGTVDFLGNLTAVFGYLHAQSKGLDEPALDDQDVIDYIWASALIYFEGEWDSRLDAVHTPKLNFSQLPPVLHRGLFELSTGQLLWIVLHELGHVLQDGHPKLSEAFGLQFPRNLEGHLDEFLADDVAFNLMIDYAIRWQDRQRVIHLLNAVDVVLGFMDLMQSAFPIYHDRQQKIIGVSESLDHPIAAVRRENYRRKVRQAVPAEFLELGREFEEIMAPFGEMIRNGHEPSTSFMLAREYSRQLSHGSHKRQ